MKNIFAAILVVLLSFHSTFADQENSESDSNVETTTDSSDSASTTSIISTKQISQPAVVSEAEAEDAIEQAKDKFKFISEFFVDGEFKYNKKFERQAYCNLNQRTAEECEVYLDYKNRHERKLKDARVAREEAVARHNASVLSACEWAVKYRSDNPLFVKKMCSKPSQDREPSSLDSGADSNSDKLIRCCLSYGSGSSCAFMKKSECQQIK